MVRKSYVYPQGANPLASTTDISQLTPTYHFYVRDHLGNNRLVVNEHGAIEQVNHYYPFGGLMGESQNFTSTQRYKYNGKELDRMHGLDWYDYGARHYDATIARWMCVDPLAEKYYPISPYVYCLDNPVRFIDEDGMDPGDRFQNMYLAAMDFAKLYNPRSIHENREYSTSIFLVKDVEGRKYYTYRKPIRGSKASVSLRDQYKIDYSDIKDVALGIVASVHTHAAKQDKLIDRKKNIDWNNEFSGNQFNKYKNKEWKGEFARNKAYHLPDDISEANRTKLKSFLVTPNWTLKLYNPDTGVVKTLNNNIPHSTTSNP